MNTYLTSSQLDAYERDGFLVVENFATLAECQALKQRAEDLVAAYDPFGDPQGVISVFSTQEQTRISDDYFLESGDKVRFFFEEDAFTADGSLRQSKERSINKIGHALHDLDPTFDRFSRRPELAAIATDLGFSQPLLVQSMYIFKQPNIGGEVTCHQDATFLYTEPMTVTGFWFALEDATLENGCLWAIPGGHKLGLKRRFSRANAATESGRATKMEVLDDSTWPDDLLVPLEVKAGTLVLLHGLLPHMSYANRSPKSRHAYAVHLVDGAAEYPADNWLRRSVDMPPRGFDLYQHQLCKVKMKK